MFWQTAEFYDLIYGFKDYASEAAKIRQLIDSERPGARSILDVACGTAEHARWLFDKFEIDGIDLEPAFIDIAKKKHPKGRFQVADMRAFDLGRRYDVVQCLFSSIAYLLEPSDVVSALKCFARHLNDGGIILVEPWFPPAAFKPGRCAMDIVDKPEIKICRMSLSQQEGDVSILQFRYLIGNSQELRVMEETHRLALVTPEQMQANFEAAGLSWKFDPAGLFGRGLYIARKKSA